MEANPDRAAPVSIRPDALYRHVAYRRDEPLPASIDQSYVVVARPGEVPTMRPDRGDILVRVALGERGPAHVAVLSSPELVPWHALDAASMPHEREGPGGYGPSSKTARGPARSGSPGGSSTGTGACPPASSCCGRGRRRWSSSASRPRIRSPHP